MSYLCTVCEHVYTDADLEDAVQVGGGRGRSRRPMTYIFADGSFHYLRKVKDKKQPQPPAQEPKEDTELQEIVNVLAALPTQPVAEIVPPVEISQLVDSISETQSDIEGPQATMAAAFKQFLNKREHAAAK